MLVDTWMNICTQRHCLVVRQKTKRTNTKRERGFRGEEKTEKSQSTTCHLLKKVSEFTQKRIFLLNTKAAGKAAQPKTVQNNRKQLHSQKDPN
jgi:hypothetical protein